ncbi:MAG: prepilin-type N-terminal cleavage/methylation domain-containing protein [Tepidisphaera sp.]|nr:prepilin-type N-terminal cleavage/methylation domain-containing protein [Tepidisphaera sp.]
MRNRMKKAFTLVEILIVVVILGILAAIVVPQFTNATEDAQAGNLKTQLSSLQNQIELYKARTNAYPDLATTGWDLLIDPNGDGNFDDGYIKEAPKNPAAPSGVQTTIGTAHAATCGWVYDSTTGKLEATYFDASTGKITPGTP